MHDNLDILELIKQNGNWEEIITNAPYNVKVSKESSLVLLKYNQIDSKKCGLTNSCRGSIIDINTKEYVCRKMGRFMNYGETSASEIIYPAQASSKEDGSIISCFYYGDEWKISTSGTVSAFDAGIPSFYSESWGMEIESFGQLFLHTLSEAYNLYDFFFLDEHKDYTHMFEICTSQNKIVTKYESPKVFYITSKNNKTGKEKRFTRIEKAVNNPVFHVVNNLEECLELCKDLRVDQEGFVIKDESGNRIKVKTKSYCRLHHVRGEGSFTHKRALDIVRENEIEEVLTYFPEFEPVITLVKMKYEKLLEDTQKFMNTISHYSPALLTDRKMFAQQISSSPYKDFGFSWLSLKVNTVEEYYRNMNTDRILRSL